MAVAVAVAVAVASRRSANELRKSSPSADSKVSSRSKLSPPFSSGMNPAVRNRSSPTARQLWLWRLAAVMPLLRGFACVFSSAGTHAKGNATGIDGDRRDTGLAGPGREISQAFSGFLKSSTALAGSSAGRITGMVVSPDMIRLGLKSASQR